MIIEVAWRSRRKIKNRRFAGPTQTGDVPLLAQTNGAPFPDVSYIPNSPLETQAPIAGNIHNTNIFQLLGNLSPYFPNPRGFGVSEYSFPLGSNVSWVNMISRHGSRYSTVSSGPQSLGQKVYNSAGNFNATGALSFLNTWKYGLGAEILVPIGKQELFNSGTLHYYQYGHRTTAVKLLLEPQLKTVCFNPLNIFCPGFSALVGLRMLL